MLLSGTVGGVLNYLGARGEEPKNASFWQSLLGGMVASFIVLLFLNMISSNPIDAVKGMVNAAGDLSKLFVLAGFCLVAGGSSRAFITTLSARVLRETKATRHEVQQMTSYTAENLISRGSEMALFGDGGRRELEKKAKEDGRLPPGQSLTLKWPVLHYGGVPHFDAAKWDFKISGLVVEPVRLTWEEFRALPQTEVTSDFHCVTRWSRLDNRWKGVLFTDVMKLIKPKPGAEFALVLAEEGYTANVPLADLLRPDVLFTFEHDGEPLAAEHGGPLRLIVPHLYAWKSVKWVRGFMLLDHDRLGFWERNGYHAYGDPWKEQRYSGTSRSEAKNLRARDASESYSLSARRLQLLTRLIAPMKSLNWTR